MGWYTQMVNAMALLYNCTSLLPSLRAQILTSVVYTVYRAFVFSMISTFNAQVGGFPTRFIPRVLPCVLNWGRSVGFAAAADSIKAQSSTPTNR